MIRTRLSLFIALCLLALLSPAAGQDPKPESDRFGEIVAGNTYSLTLKDGKITGPAEAFLNTAMNDVQFVAFGESHNKRAVHGFGSALFTLLQERHGFQYLALEEDPVWASMVTAQARKGDEAVFELVRRFPNSFHLLSEEEIRMIAGVARISRAKQPVWGLNQVYSALHIYSRLAELAPNPEARAVAERLREDSREYEGERFGKNKHYLLTVARSSDFQELRSAFKPSADSEAAFLIDQIELSYSIFAPYGTEPRPSTAVFYESGRRREANMKRLFGERYRSAVADGDAMPKVLAMFGHLHMYRGLSERTEQYTLGNMMSELAEFNGKRSFHLYVEVNTSYSNSSFFARFTKAALEAGGDGAIIDLRPLFDLAKNNKDMEPQLRRMIMSFDAFVMMKDGEWGSVERFETPNFHWYPD